MIGLGDFSGLGGHRNNPAVSMPIPEGWKPLPAHDDALDSFDFPSSTTLGKIRNMIPAQAKVAEFELRKLIPLRFSEIEPIQKTHTYIRNESNLAYLIKANFVERISKKHGLSCAISANGEPAYFFHQNGRSISIEQKAKMKLGFYKDLKHSNTIFTHIQEKLGYMLLTTPLAQLDALFGQK